jgi:hypothetical protein
VPAIFALPWGDPRPVTVWGISSKLKGHTVGRAVGLINITTPEEQAILDASSGIFLYPVENLSDLFDTLGQPAQNAVQDFLSEIGAPPAEPTDTLRDILDRVLNGMQRGSLAEYEALIARKLEG